MATEYITVSDEKFYHSRRKTADTLNDLNEKCRYDALGNEISKKSKKQKVTFVDNLSSKKIVEIIEYDEYSIINKCNYYLYFCYILLSISYMN